MPSSKPPPAPSGPEVPKTPPSEAGVLAESPKGLGVVVCVAGTAKGFCFATPAAPSPNEKLSEGGKVDEDELKGCVAGVAGAGAVVAAGPDAETEPKVKAPPDEPSPKFELPKLVPIDAVEEGALAPKNGFCSGAPLDAKGFASPPELPTPVGAKGLAAAFNVDVVDPNPAAGAADATEIVGIPAASPKAGLAVLRPTAPPDPIELSLL